VVFVTFRRCELEGRGNHGNPAILSSRSCNLSLFPTLHYLNTPRPFHL
ncbi:unnamed protein product, partial [Ectocarpus sp. 8 AP-2014]